MAQNRAAAFIESYVDSHRDADDDDASTFRLRWDLYHGMAGGILFLAELGNDVGRTPCLRTLAQGLAGVVPRLLDGGELAGAVRAPLEPGLYSGVAGVGFALAEAWLATGSAACRAAIVSEHQNSSEPSKP